MPILKEGVILKNKFLFERTDKPYYCSLGLGTWTPTVSSSEIIFDSESTVTRFIPTITTGWNETGGSDFVNISFVVNYPDDITFNRVILYYGGLQRSHYDVQFNGFNSITITDPNSHEFTVGDRIIYNKYFYEILTISGLDIGVIPLTNSPQLPHTGYGYIRDASGIPLIGSVMDDVYIINNNNTINFYLNGTST
jgi:hypothetical protein